jgi:general secretion pathway protein D
MLEIVKYIDQPSALRMETRVFLLTHAKAGDVVARLQAIIQETLQLGARTAAPAPTPQPTPIPGRPVARPAATTAVAGAEDLVVEGKVIITPDERTNKIFIFSRPSNFPFFERIISELDSKVEPDVVVKVITLDYADAVDVASLVNSLITGGSPTTTSTRRRSTGSTTGSRTTPVPAPPAAIPAAAGGGASEAGFLDFAEGVRILPDQRTNSLLVMATKEDLARIEAMVRSVDTAVAQVLIEVVIAEVKLDGQLDVGVEAFKRAFGNDPTSIGGYRTGQPNSPFEVLRDASTNLTALALSSGLTYFTTFSHLKLDAVIRVLATSSKFKVLSTPIIQTLHNQEANIVVGESRPVPVSTVSSVVGGTGTLTTGQLNSNIEFKDIAIELTVTPRINPNGYVTMDIQQKVNDVGGSVPFNGTEVPIITKREAKSSVAVRDGNTIVLGGMIQENKTVTETKVPLLGDIPLFGTLFKGKSNKKSRTELIVFIKPTVLRSDPQAAAEALRRARLLKAGQDLELEKRLESPVPEVPANELYKGLSSAPRSIPSEFDRQTAKARALERAPVKTN